MERTTNILSICFVVSAVGSACAQSNCDWSAVGDGLDGTVYALASFDDGNGAKLYAGGRFIDPSTRAVSFIKCWDGQAWQPVGGGVNNEVYALIVYDDGGGPDLYAGGMFSVAAGVWAPGVARWDGASWSGLGGNLSGHVYALETMDTGLESVLCVGGSFTEAYSNSQNLARWNGTSWSCPGAGSWECPDGPVRALKAVDFGGPDSLFVGGSFTYVGGWTVANNIAKLDGNTWSALGTGTNSHVYSIEWFNQLPSPGLYVGGPFSWVDGVEAWHIARWIGGNWSPVGGYFEIEQAVNALEIFDEPAGPMLFAGRDFVPDALLSTPARWNGTEWSAVGTGVQGGNGTVFAMTIHDDGNGPALYVGGDFDGAGDIASQSVARWSCTPEPCLPDLNGDDTLDFFDVQRFLQLFAAHDDTADFTGDGLFDFFDIQAFLQTFSAGCP